MTTMTLITREPCESCTDVGHETETGAGYCKRSPSGDCECDDYLTANLIDEIARDVAMIYRRLGNHDMRRELAAGTADAFDSALGELHRGAQFDCDGFRELCGCARGVAA
jgi:hypothetical protein